MARHPQLFDFNRHLARLTAAGDPLVKLDTLIEWEVFHPLFADFRKKSEHPQGRRPYNENLMLKILILQHLYALSDDQTDRCLSVLNSFLPRRDSAQKRER